MRKTLYFVLLLAAVVQGQTNGVDQALWQEDSTSRLRDMKRIESIPLSVTDGAMLSALAICADDPLPQVRAEVACIVGWNWIQRIDEPSPQAIAIELKLANDPDDGVRHDVVTAALERVKHKDDRVVAALVELGMTLKEYDGNIQAHVMAGLQGTPADKLIPLLEPYWANFKADPQHAVWAYLIYLGSTHQQPPRVERLENVGAFIIEGIGKSGFSKADVERELQSKIPAGILQRFFIAPQRGQIWVYLLMNGVGNRRRIVAALHDNPKIDLYDDPSRFTINIAEPSAVAWVEEQAAAATRPAATQGNYAAAFRELYEYLGQMYPNFQMKGIDWKKIGTDFLPRAQQVKTEREFGLLVEELVAKLQDSHAVIEAGSAQPPAPDIPLWDPGLACLIDDRDRAVIYAVQKDSPAERAGIKPGMTVLSVNGVQTQRAIEQTMRCLVQYCGYSSDRVLTYDAVRSFDCQRQRGTVVNLVIEQINGERKTFALAADYGRRYLPRLPVPREGINDSGTVSWTRIDGNVGYMYVRRIEEGLEALLDRALSEMKGIDGLIIDVRGNSGGGFDPETAIRNFDLSPDNTAQPERPRYRGPIALLIDSRTISAAEGWASWFIANKRATLFGTTTAGASSRKEIYTLSNGMYRVVVPVKAYSGFLDRPIECRGLQPDIEVRCNARDLTEHRDTVVDTAVQWLETERSK